MAGIDGATASELMNQAIAGTLEVGTEANEDNTVDVEDNEIGNDEVTNSEDTDNEVEVEDQSDTDEQIDGDAQEDTDESDKGDGDSNTQDEEENASTSEDNTADGLDTEDTTDNVDETEDNTTDSETDTTDGADGDTEEDNTDPAEEKIENNGIDVEEYNRLKDFHEKLTTTEFTVNGRKKTGFDTVEDLIAAQQKAGGIEKKFKAVKEIQPFMQSMKDNGFISDPAKYELAVRAGNGDIDALKQIIIDNKIDPLMDLDVEEGSKYEAKNEMVTSVGEIAYNEAKEIADNMGVTRRFEEVMFNEFDKESREEIFKDPATTKAIGIALAEQIENGLYDQVMDQVDTMSVRDPKFANLSTLERYNAASEVVNSNNAKAYEAEQKVTNDAKTAEVESKKTKEAEAKKVKQETAKIEKARKEKEYKAKAKEQEKKTNAARSKASQASKPKPGATSTTKKSSPLDLPKEEFASLWKDLLALND